MRGFITLNPPVLLFIFRTRQILYVHKLHHVGGACLSEQSGTSSRPPLEVA